MATMGNGPCRDHCSAWRLLSNWRFARSDAGTPGAGTSMLACRLATMLPAMSLAEALETTRLPRVAGLTSGCPAVVTTRPFQAPHPTIAAVDVIGGVQIPLPGEVLLAHHGLRLVDELPECTRHGLEVFHQPLEKSITRIQSCGHPRPHTPGYAGSPVPVTMIETGTCSRSQPLSLNVSA
jgi:Magnesium chelatase, subunit ChlI